MKSEIERSREIKGRIERIPSQLSYETLQSQTSQVTVGHKAHSISHIRKEANGQKLPAKGLS